MSWLCLSENEYLNIYLEKRIQNWYIQQLILTLSLLGQTLRNSSEIWHISVTTSNHEIILQLCTFRMLCVEDDKFAKRVWLRALLKFFSLKTLKLLKPDANTTCVLTNRCSRRWKLWILSLLFANGKYRLSTFKQIEFCGLNLWKVWAPLNADAFHKLPFPLNRQMLPLFQAKRSPNIWFGTRCIERHSAS